MSKADIEQFMKSEIGAALSVEPDDIDENLNFLKIGMSSVQALKIINRVRKRFEAEISPVALFEYKTIAEFAGHVHECLLEKVPE
ncbi:acyl carrier protein [Saccharibacillus sp. CPCC 101409]|uniref:acyl carrier protein n=1 Tax=Saccharibacillus sp. CPCC 101409 TaxID=3058041 RepID=UPI00267265D2|nr:acyl carrier protein [Saccharibacillus sp. CPCC 101409]MDO3410498.1 acyl carrier protein [Saccharibacillus sp. CPCC 101409]